VIGWVDETKITEGLWPDVILLEAADRDAYLQTAFEQCLEYAPVLGPTDPVPGRYAMAQIAQASELFAMARANDGEVLGQSAAGFEIRVKPLSTSVKSLLRPRRAVPEVG
jgi:hypothetical protein